MTDVLIRKEIGAQTLREGRPCKDKGRRQLSTSQEVSPQKKATSRAVRKLSSFI